MQSEGSGTFSFSGRFLSEGSTIIIFQGCFRGEKSGWIEGDKRARILLIRETEKLVHVKAAPLTNHPRKEKGAFGRADLQGESCGGGGALESNGNGGGVVLELGGRDKRGVCMFFGSRSQLWGDAPLGPEVIDIWSKCTRAENPYV